mgnify:CR=1 FL=1
MAPRAVAASTALPLPQISQEQQWYRAQQEQATNISAEDEEEGRRSAMHRNIAVHQAQP